MKVWDRAGIELANPGSAVILASVARLRTVLRGPVEPVLSSHSKIDKTKVLKTSGSLVQVKNIAECSTRAFCNTFDLH